MRRAVFIVLGLLAGVALAQVMTEWVTLRRLIGPWFQHGELVALVHGRGLYTVDVDRAVAALEARGEEGGEWSEAVDRYAVLLDLAANLSAQHHGRLQNVSPGLSKRRLGTLRFQLPGPAWLTALQHSGTNEFLLRNEIESNEGALLWLEHELEKQIRPSPADSAAYYEEHAEEFRQPARARASHVFLAASAEKEVELFYEKRAAMLVLKTRQLAGEDFTNLAATASEDEATKKRGGDLNWFSLERMPSDFSISVQKPPEGKVSDPVGTKLGHHLFRVTGRLPARLQTLEEARAEVELALANRGRAAATRQMARDLSGEATFLSAAP